MRRYKGLLVIAALLMILLGLVVFQTKGMRTTRAEERKRISLIVYGDDTERWESLRQGAGLVCKQNNADLSLLTMLSEDDVAEQNEIIDREIEDGADALIVAACNSEGIRDHIAGIGSKVPVVYVESLVSDNNEISIAPDDYNMGLDLGRSIVENESDIVTVAIISENTDRDSVSLREKGLREAIDGKVGKILEWKRDEKNRNAQTRMFIQKAIVSEATDVIVTFDNSATDALLDALTNLNKKSKVYSISTSNKSVYSLYKGEIKTLEYSNEFSMGYLAAMHAIDGSYAEKKHPDETIDYRIVRKENMYDEDNQELLFPFVN
ncbi:MAG: substrate-binding domain-containing protein [Lachnospiraceae bacterium]|nr:substrate-binding domain-containing protein [Lachnospiraceae bacterium]